MRYRKCRRVEKVKVISEFRDNLTSTDDLKRQIAIKAIFIALPDEAARRVNAVEQSGKPSDSPITRQNVAAAKDALDLTRATDDAKLRARIADFLKSAARNSDDTRRLIATMQERFQT